MASPIWTFLTEAHRCAHRHPWGQRLHSQCMEQKAWHGTEAHCSEAFKSQIVVVQMQVLEECD
eukprot:7601697-Karenia_brevis.AAC.1